MDGTGALQTCRIEELIANICTGYIINGDLAKEHNEVRLIRRSCRYGRADRTRVSIGSERGPHQRARFGRNRHGINGAVAA